MNKFKITLIVFLTIIINTAISPDEMSSASLKDNKTLTEKYFGMTLGINYDQTAEIINRTKKGFIKKDNALIVLGSLTKLYKAVQTRFVFKDQRLSCITICFEAPVYYYKYLCSELKKEIGSNKNFSNDNSVLWNDKESSVEIRIVYRDNKKSGIYLSLFLNGGNADTVTKKIASLSFGGSAETSGIFFKNTSDLGFANGISLIIAFNYYFSNYFALGFSHTVGYEFTVCTYENYDDYGDPVQNFPFLSNNIINSLKLNFKFGNVLKNSILIETGIIAIISFDFPYQPYEPRNMTELGWTNYFGYEFKNNGSFIFSIGANINLILLRPWRIEYKTYIGIEARLRFCRFMLK